MRPITRLTALALVAAGALAGPAAAASASGSPSVTATSPTHVGQTTARFNGTVDPNGATTSYVFQYGLTSAYGLATRARSVGHGTRPVAVSSSASGLIPGTAYHFRIVALNAHGAAIGRDHTFTTTGPPPPGATTGPPTAIGVNSATLTGVINPNGAVTGYEFQYGETTSYGAAIPYPPTSVPSGTAPVTVSATVTGLQEDHFFHYRLVAFHQVGPASYGADQVLLTEPSSKFRPKVTASTLPHRRRHRPFVFTTHGRIGGPASIPAAFDCTGNVAVRFYFGKRNISFELAPVASDCTFSVPTMLARKPGRGPRNRRVTLRVVVYFRGNGYLKPRFAASERVTLG